MLVSSITAHVALSVVLAAEEPTSADWWQVGVGAFGAISTFVVATAAWLTSRRAAKTAEAAALSAQAAVKTEKDALEYHRQTAERADRLTIVEDLLRLHNHLELINDGTSASTWWWDLEAKTAVAADKNAWRPIADLWQLAKDRYAVTNKARDPAFRGEFKAHLFAWAHSPGQILPIYGWIRTQRAELGTVDEASR
ncbi:hypothetical protein [Mycobacterium sp. NPDC050441]|uniref:hypothetical protein n=1 Tax=Mycobacterium sp. NPDC050441 TaxID=3155403 RepID=UPI0033F81062